MSDKQVAVDVRHLQIIVAVVGFVALIFFTKITIAILFGFAAGFFTCLKWIKATLVPRSSAGPQ